MKTVLFAILCSLFLGGFTAARCNQKASTDAIFKNAQVEETGGNPDNQNPSIFGPRLAKHPEDEGYRIAALIYYGLNSKDYTQLRRNTFAMIKYHPDDDNIFDENITEFYIHPDYRKEVIQRLEQQLKRGHREHILYWTLAQTCANGAVPPVYSPAERKSFIEYMQLPQNIALQTKIDPVLANKAILYYHDAIAAAGDDDFSPAFYSEQLAELYQGLGQTDKAVAVCQKALPKAGSVEKSGLLAEFGDCLMQAGRLDDAKTALDQVRGCDTGGYQNGPADDTIEAETDLGLIALKQGDLSEAGKHLLASCQVQKSPADTTKGFSLDLASALLHAGQTKPVIQFCQTVLTNFTPTDSGVKSLLHRAQKAEENAPA